MELNGFKELGKLPMEKTRIIRVSVEFDDELNRQLERLLADCRTLGIPPRQMSKTKATRLLADKMKEQEIITMRLFGQTKKQ